MVNDKGNTNAILNLCKHYEYTEKNYEEMKKYYLMVIDKGNSVAMHSLGIYYQFTEKNYEKMKKYY